MNKTLHINGNEVTLDNIVQQPGSLRFSYKGKPCHFRSRKREDGSFLLEEESASGIWHCVSDGGAWNGAKAVRNVQIGALEAKISDTPSPVSAHSQEPLCPLAPMPGLVRQVLVKKGDKVARGQTLVVVEAMKLQLALTAGADAVVDAVLVKAGQLVPEGAELVKLTAK